MRLSAGDVAGLPLACALFDRTGQLVAATPEWTGFSLGALTYEAGIGRLVVVPDGCSSDVDSLVTDLISEVGEAATALTPPDRLAVEMLAAALALVAGRGLATGATAPLDELLAYVHEGVRRSAGGAPLEVVVDTPAEVPAPAALAVGLLQLVRNAVRHSGAERLTLRVGRGPTFRVEWDAAGDEASPVATSRRPDQRARWGLGYARLLADALGGVVTAPGPVAPGRVGAAIGLGSPRLSAPLAAVAGGRIERATRAWDEETGLPPGSAPDGRVDAAVVAAAAHPGHIGYADIFRSRDVGPRTWLAVAPQSSTGRARDLLRGMQHENALLSAPEPRATRIYAISAVLTCALDGVLPEPVAAATWARDFGPACAALGISPLPGVDPDRLRFPDPRMTAYLLSQLQGEIVEGGAAAPGGMGVYLRVAAAAQSHPLVRLLRGQDGLLALLA